MSEDNREIYEAYRRAHTGHTDAYTRYWPFMSDSAKEWYKEHHNEDSPIVARTIEQLLTKLLAKELDKLFKAFSR